MFTKKLLPILMFSIASLGIIGCSSDDSTDDVPEVYTGQFKQKVLVEDITSASCVWCPLATFAIEELEASEFKDKIVAVAVHGDYDVRNVKDPFVLPGMTDLMRAVNLTGWPHISWNRNSAIRGTDFQSFIPKRNNGSGAQYTFDTNLFTNFYTKNNLFAEGSPIGIKIESNLDITKGNVNVSLTFGEDLNQDLKYVIYVVEDGLVFRQANASTLYGNTSGSARWEVEFVHDHVVRATNNFLGEPIEAGETVVGNEFKVSSELTYTIENIENVSVVVAILDKSGNVLNTQKAKANITQDYEKI